MKPVKVKLHQVIITAYLPSSPTLSVTYVNIYHVSISIAKDTVTILVGFSIEPANQIVMMLSKSAR